MAYDNVRHFMVGVEASTNLSSHQHKFVVMGASGIALNTADGGEVDGVLEDKPSAAGQAAAVAISPSVVKVLAAGAIAKGALVKSDASGLAATAGAGEFAVGRALTAVAAANELVVVQLMPFGNV